jgi:hypothetical protein
MLKCGRRLFRVRHAHAVRRERASRERRHQRRGCGRGNEPLPADDASAQRSRCSLGGAARWRNASGARRCRGATPSREFNCIAWFGGFLLPGLRGKFPVAPTCTLLARVSRGSVELFLTLTTHDCRRVFHRQWRSATQSPCRQTDNDKAKQMMLMCQQAFHRDTLSFRYCL